jgi:hypothetical protein
MRVVCTLPPSGGADDLMRSAEARARQAPVLASPPPTLNTFTSALRAGGPPMHELEARTNGKLTGDPQEESHNTRSEYDIEVQVDMSMIRDTR